MAIVSSAAMHVRVHVSFWISFVWIYIIVRNGTAISYGNSVFSFMKNLHSFTQWLYQLIFPPTENIMLIAI